MVLVIKNPPANAGDERDLISIPESGRSLGVGNGNPLQYSSLENSTDRGAWHAAVHGATKSWTRLSNWAHVLYLDFKLPIYQAWFFILPASLLLLWGSLGMELRMNSGASRPDPHPASHSRWNPDNLLSFSSKSQCSHLYNGGNVSAHLRGYGKEWWNHAWINVTSHDEKSQRPPEITSIESKSFAITLLRGESKSWYPKVCVFIISQHGIGEFPWLTWNNVRWHHFVWGKWKWSRSVVSDSLRLYGL